MYSVCCEEDVVAGGYMGLLSVNKTVPATRTEACDSLSATNNITWLQATCFCSVAIFPCFLPSWLLGPMQGHLVCLVRKYIVERSSYDFLAPSISINIFFFFCLCLASLLRRLITLMSAHISWLHLAALYKYLTVPVPYILASYNQRSTRKHDNKRHLSAPVVSVPFYIPCDFQ